MKVPATLIEERIRERFPWVKYGAYIPTAETLEFRIAMRLTSFGNPSEWATTTMRFSIRELCKVFFDFKDRSAIDAEILAAALAYPVEFIPDPEAVTWKPKGRELFDSILNDTIMDLVRYAAFTPNEKKG